MSCASESPRVIDLGAFAVGSVDRIRVTLLKDDVAWNLASAVVTFTFIPPSGEDFDRTATVESASEGIAYYDTTTTDLDEVGYWTLRVTVVDGAVTKVYPYDINLNVNF